MTAKTNPATIQFSLATLLLGMTWVALVCISLTSPNRLWSAVISAVTILALLTAVVVAIYGQENARAFAVGFAIFGCGYLLTLHRFDGYTPQLAHPSGEFLFQTIHQDAWSPLDAQLKASRIGNTQAQVVIQMRDRFVEIFKSASVILVATLGGILARYLLVRHRPSHE